MFLMTVIQHMPRFEYQIHLNCFCFNMSFECVCVCHGVCDVCVNRRGEVHLVKSLGVSSRLTLTPKKTQVSLQIKEMS